MSEILEFNTEIWNKLTMDITKGEYVLLLGGDIIMNADSGHGMDSAACFKKLIKERRQADEDFDNLSPRERMLSVVEDHSFSADDVSPDLRSLLATKCFRTVLTTTTDHYVEAAMREIWGDSLKVLDIYGDSYDEFDIDDNAVSDEFYETKPTLYYVYGKANPMNRNKKFALEENDYLEVISRWLNTETRPNKFCEHLSRKQLLAVGCKYENWYFRFLWYALRGNIQLPLRGRRNSISGKVALTLNLEDMSDFELGRYLRREGVYTYPNSCEFIGKLSESLNQVRDSFNSIRAKGGVFISYASEDSAMAAVIFNHLCSAGFNVWLDSRKLFGGDHYDDRIEDAISQCKIFLPVLSGQTVLDFTAGVERYYVKEWKAARQNCGKLKIIPVSLQGYDVKSPVNDEVKAIIGHETSYEFGKKPISELCELVSKSL